VTDDSARTARPSPGAIASVALGLLLLAFALSAGLPRNAQGVAAFKGDEASYYSLAHSLARDFDFSFERRDLVRVWEEYPSGPEGIWLKRGKSVHLEWGGRFPFVRWIKSEDPVRTRLYYAKSFIYPLAAAPFVFVFGTPGFFVLHALLLSLDLFVAYTFLAARARSPRFALAFALVFLLASVVPVHFVWFAPELFNFSLALYALFFWCYKEVAGDRLTAGGTRFLLGARSDAFAAALVGVLIFSKPTHALLFCPMVALAAGRRQWLRIVGMGMACTIAAGSLFLANAAITGEFNYQGGDRKTFYGAIGFPFANDWETFENIGPVRGREGMMVGDVLVNSHTLTVFKDNAIYFVMGRSSGLLPYCFPGVASAVLFLLSRKRQRWQWLVVATIVGSALLMILIWPFTYSGGGGPVGNRYFVSFYPLFLFLTPPLAGFSSAMISLGMGALFTARIILNPFYSSFNPGEHLKSGPSRWLPLELTLLNDLPVAFNADRVKRPLGGSPPVLAYFPDDNAYLPEKTWFWVRGKSRAEVILRAPVVDAGGGRFISKAIARLGIDIENGGRPDRVSVSTGRESRTLDMKPAEVVHLDLAVPDGVPYHRDPQPTSYVYLVSIGTTSGFVPFLANPGQASDSRFLGARVLLAPQYVDAETSVWSIPPTKP
jgi:hypothetical protein